MSTSGVIADDKRNLYSPEIFLYDKTFDPIKHNLNSPSVISDEKVKGFSTGKINCIPISDIEYDILLKFRKTSINNLKNPRPRICPKSNVNH